ncbi:unnamed protein product [Orchesella dallaii]|uniref:Granulins domain-containing protein n=1 Tax=Orchesella dallaii TaxID=48710 RepID=A0ABP1Q2D8_9HEXA
MSSTIPRFQLLAIFIASLIVASCLADLCPDHKKSCRKGQTCCDDKQGGFGCCPYENATCCTDGLHCCPQETSCDLSAGRCRRNKSQKQLLLVPATKSEIISNVLEGNSLGAFFHGTSGDKQRCPDQKQSCPSTYTCCQAPEEGYSCCPYANATCCADKIHCCAQGSKCSNGRCE